MGDVLKRVGSEFTLGNIPQRPRRAEIPFTSSFPAAPTQRIDPVTGEGSFEQDQTEPVEVERLLTVEEPRSRPTFLSSFLSNLGPALGAGFAAGSQGKTAGEAFGLALGGAFEGPERQRRRRFEEEAKTRELDIEERRVKALDRPKPADTFAKLAFEKFGEGKPDEARKILNFGKEPGSFESFALDLFREGREEEAKRVLEFGRRPQTPIARASGRDLVFIDPQNQSEVGRIKNFTPTSPATARFDQRRQRDEQINQLASALLLQAGGKASQALKLAIQQAGQDPQGFTAKNLSAVLRAIRTGNVDSSIDRLIELLAGEEAGGGEE